MKLKPEELQYLESESQECEKCGHLRIFHNYHCCSFCNIPGCKCEFEDGGVERDGYKDPTSA